MASRKIDGQEFFALFKFLINSVHYNLKNNYPFLFPEQYNSEVWINRLNDTIQKEIYNEINLVYPNLDDEKNDLIKFYNNFTSYFPTYRLPRIITLISDVQYENRVILADSLLLIGLDNYLGKNHRFYEGIPLYIKEDLTRNHIIKDIALQYAIKFTPKLDDYTFLDKIIYHGKLLYYIDITLKKTDENIKIGYSKNKLDWATENEFFVWTYFIENEILFNPDNKLNNRFINDAPFSRFYFENDNESTEMIGKYIGWKIVKSFMKNNDISVSDMMNTKQIEIYNKSKYKPKK